MAYAAIFDLDRTLIAGSSAQVFGGMLNDVGIKTPKAPGHSLYFRLYERFGEDPIMMRLARQSSRLFTNHRVGAVEAAGLLAADVLINAVYPDARAEIERQRRSGAVLVLATTSSHDLVWPLAQALGVDELICTHFRAVDGVYDGTIDGEYVWGAQKAAAVATWAGTNGIDLPQSWAYSDSWYDVALLELVGTPIAVNADARLRALAFARRWTIRDFEQPRWHARTEAKLMKSIVSVLPR